MTDHEHPMRRVEDRALITGAARYTEDIAEPDALHLAFVRSPMAHAAVESIDVSTATKLPGVVEVLTAKDLDLPTFPATDGVSDDLGRPLLARDRVRFAGEAVAVVVAKSREQAIDATESVLVDYSMLDAVVAPEEAVSDSAPRLFDGHDGNVVVTNENSNHDDPLEDADVVVRARLVNQRVAPVPLEVNTAMAKPDGEGVAILTTCQAPFMVREWVAQVIGLPENLVVVRAPVMGGGFGARIPPYPEQAVCAALALRYKRPVRFVETRSESLVSMSHGRAQIQQVELGAKSDGRLTGVRADVIADLGAYPSEAALLPELTGEMLSGVYSIPRISFSSRGVVTNTTPVGAYRGAGRPEATALIERAMDILAAELQIDPAELRRRNFVTRDAFPYETGTGITYDSGNYEDSLEKVLDLAGYDGWRTRQQERRDDGGRIQIGIGISCYVEMTGFGSEFAGVSVDAEGKVTASTGLSPHGQGTETATVQIVSSRLRIPPEDIHVVHSDTRVIPRGGGTMGSRSLQVGGSAMLKASEEVLERAYSVVEDALEVARSDIELTDGAFEVRGAPDRKMTWAEVARHISDTSGDEKGLSVESDFEMEDLTFPFGAHIAVVEVDLETGDVDLMSVVTVDDCGTVLNEMLVQGQVHGGLAQGIGQALFEEFVYDELGNPLTPTLANYGFPGPSELPSFDTHRMQTPSPMNPLGAKGIGESGTIGITPAVQNAVVDALRPLGVVHVDMPLTPQRVWAAIAKAARN